MASGSPEQMRALADRAVQTDDGYTYSVPARDLVEYNAVLRAAADEMDRLRAEADVVYRSAYRLGRQHSGADMYKQQANELRTVIENAPHEAECSLPYYGFPVKCNCWKAGAL